MFAEIVIAPEPAQERFRQAAGKEGWESCMMLYGLDTQPQLVQTVANTIVQNTSGPKEANDFWSRAELNLLMALIHYVVNLRDANGNLLPIEQRGLGDVYRMIATESIEEINRRLAALPPEHPAKYPHGLFLKAKENLWGNIVIGLGNRLAVFQSRLVDKITRNHDVDLLLPGKRPCVYFVIISAQDSAYRFLSSLFFSLALPQLSNFARLQCAGGRLPVLTNFCLDEYCNIGYSKYDYKNKDTDNSRNGHSHQCLHARSPFSAGGASEETRRAAGSARQLRRSRHNTAVGAHTWCRYRYDRTGAGLHRRLQAPRAAAAKTLRPHLRRYPRL